LGNQSLLGQQRRELLIALIQHAARFGDEALKKLIGLLWQEGRQRALRLAPDAIRPVIPLTVTVRGLIIYNMHPLEAAKNAKLAMSAKQALCYEARARVGCARDCLQSLEDGGAAPEQIMVIRRALSHAKAAFEHLDELFKDL
jgi:hypothetical protein